MLTGTYIEVLVTIVPSGFQSDGKQFVIDVGEERATRCEAGLLLEVVEVNSNYSGSGLVYAQNG